jgi:hypothetical protein
MQATAQNTRCGALIRDDYGRLCLVNDIHYDGCPQSDKWIEAQDKPITTKERKDDWLSTTPLDGGGVCSPMSRCEIVLTHEQVATVLREHLVEVKEIR